MISLITCVNNFDKYRKNVKLANAELIAIDNTKNKYSAAQALNAGVKEAKNNIIVCCHQDIIFPENWADKLIKNIQKVKELSRNKMGIVGTAGVKDNGHKHGYMGDGKYGHWNEGGIRIGMVQTVDESCFAFEKSLGLRFDEQFNHFHFYGADLCLQALSIGKFNYGIDAEVTHLSGGGESSMGKGRGIFKREMMKLKNKWIKKFPRIWTTTVVLSPNKEAILADYIIR